MTRKREQKMEAKHKKKGLDLSELLKENEDEEVVPSRQRKRQRVDNESE